jgi:HD-GYP domain-containing protein (c-di-GMP phosphodiesterase class II)
MTTNRPYRRALGLDVALEEITKNRSRLYDGSVVDACLSIIKKGFKLSDDVRYVFPSRLEL